MTSQLTEVDFRGPGCGGHLNMDGATLTNPGGTALSAENATIGHDMYCGDGFTASGGIDLRGAQIGALLGLDGARLSNPGEIALWASMITVGHSMSCGYGFTATGEIQPGRRSHPRRADACWRPRHQP